MMSPKLQPCVIRTRLIEELTSAHRNVAALGDQEVGAVVRGDMEAVRQLQGSLRQARAIRDEAMRAFRDHLGEHGC